MRNLIGFTGYKFSGKDTAASVLIAAGYQKMAMADPLKAMLSTMYTYAGLSSQEITDRLEGHLKEVPDPILCYKTPRYAMQTLGTEWRNFLGNDLWTNIMDARIRAHDGPIVITDIRFQHEVDMLHEMSGVLIRVTRPGQSVELSHVSESGIGNLHADYEIFNDGSVEDLHNKVRSLFSAV